MALCLCKGPGLGNLLLKIKKTHLTLTDEMSNSYADTGRSAMYYKIMGVIK